MSIPLPDPIDATPTSELARLACRALDRGPTGLAVIGFDARCLSVNRTLAEWAVPARTVASFEGEEFVLAGSRGAGFDRALERARQGELVVIEVERAPLLERLGRFRLHVMPFQPRGVTEALSVAFEDLTEHALAAEAFEASERRFRTLVDGATDGIAVHRNGVLLYINPAGIRMLGYASADEIIGCRVLDFVHADYRQQVSERIAELGRTGRVPAREEVFLRRDGSAVTVETAGCRVPLDDGLANFVFLRDVTERKQLEAELNRTSRMESLGRLAGSVAHDFNNLLSVIQGGVGIARLRQGDPASVSESLEAADAAARRAADLTRQLLTFSRGGEAQPTLTDPVRVIDEAVSLVAHMSGHRLPIDFSEKPDVGNVWMGPSQLHQVVLNLLLNARDAIGETGKITVRVERKELGPSVRPPARAGRWLRLSISDTGSGMDGPTRARIFEPFFTTKAPGHGTGLGLSTAYGIVRQAGGFIDVHSVLGTGTRFEVYLPLANEDVAS